MPHHSDIFKTRLDLLQKKLGSQQIIIIAKPFDIHYFTGFPFLVPEEREALLLVTAKSAHLHYAGFTPYKVVPPGLTTHPILQLSAVKKTLEQLAVTVNATQVEADFTHLTVHEFRALEKTSPVVSWIALDNQLIWDQRQVKDARELAALRHAGQIAARAWLQFEQWLKPGVTESYLAELLDSTAKQLGSDKPAFPTIVAFGPHSAVPHHQPTTTKLKKNQPVLVDFGATYNGYRSDMTRTIWFGDQPSIEFQTIQKQVQSSYITGLNEIRSRWPEITASQLDQAVRDYFRKDNVQGYFIHTSGHGIGLDIHEPPSIYLTNHTQLKPGMTITLEPGLYFAGSLGYRYENTLLLTEAGAEELTRCENETDLL